MKRGTPLAPFFTMKELRYEGFVRLLEMEFEPRRHYETKDLFKGLRRKEGHEAFEEGTPLAPFFHH